MLSDLLFSCPPRHVCNPRTVKLLDTTPTSYLIISLPSPLAWCKAFHTSDDGSIYQILLRVVSRIRQKLDEGQDGVNPLQGFNKLTLVSVIHSTRRDSMRAMPPGNPLGHLSNRIVVNSKYGVATHIPAQDSYLVLIRSYQCVDDFLGNFCREKSALFGNMI